MRISWSVKACCLFQQLSIVLNIGNATMATLENRWDGIIFFSPQSTWTPSWTWLLVQARNRLQSVSYLSEPGCPTDLTVSTPSRQLHSSADTRMLCIPHGEARTFGKCSSYCAPKRWNYLPSDVHHIHSSHAFKIAFLSPPTPHHPGYIPSVPHWVWWAMNTYFFFWGFIYTFLLVLQLITILAYSSSSTAPCTHLKTRHFNG